MRVTTTRTRASESSARPERKKQQIQTQYFICLQILMSNINRFEGEERKREGEMEFECGIFQFNICGSMYTCTTIIRLIITKKQMSFESSTSPMCVQ